MVATRKMLTPEECWYQKSSGVSKVLASAFPLYQERPGARKGLVQERSGVRILLVPGKIVLRGVLTLL
jgi:hypothetical protein